MSARVAACAHSCRVRRDCAHMCAHVCIHLRHLAFYLNCERGRCGHCQKLKGPYKKLGKAFAGVDGVHVGAVDATVESTLAQRYKVEGYPTLKSECNVAILLLLLLLLLLLTSLCVDFFVSALRRVQFSRLESLAITMALDLPAA